MFWPFIWNKSSYLWKAVIQEKQTKREGHIREALKDVSVSDTELNSNSSPLSATAAEITGRIEGGEWTALQVVNTFIRRAATAHRVTNCLTEVLFDQARREAALLDAEFAETRKLRGRLHGVPVTIKDQFDIKGYDSSIGFTYYANKPATSDASIVKTLRAEGAIIISKTNIPQTMFGFECNNPLWGRTVNPWNSKFTCGGSSGGEAAVLAMSGSVIGIGSDTGGSLRIPAAYCGVYSLKPGGGRFSRIGARAGNPGREGYASTPGPLTRTLDDLELTCRLCFGVAGHASESIAPIRYRDVKLNSKLKFGYYTSDGVVKASPACKRAVIDTVEALRLAGHECLEIDITTIRSIMIETFKTFVSLSSADGYETLLRPLGRDPLDPSMWLVTVSARVPYFIRKLASWMVKYIRNDAIYAEALLQSRPKKVSEVYKAVTWRNECQRRWYDEVWDQYDLDGIICPVQAVPALPHDATKTLSPLCISTAVFNVIDCPIGILPVTRVDKNLDALTSEWTGLKAADSGSNLLEGALYTGKKPFYDVKAMHGLPVGIQLLGRLWEDEKVIAMMRVVDEALGPRTFGPTALL